MPTLTWPIDAHRATAQHTSPPARKSPTLPNDFGFCAREMTSYQCPSFIPTLVTLPGSAHFSLFSPNTSPDLLT